MENQTSFEFTGLEHTINNTSLESLGFFDSRIKVSLDEGARWPTKAHKTDAGWDLYSRETCVVQAGKRLLVSTGIHFAVPMGCVGLIWPRSGLSAKHGIDILAGVIDYGYTGEIKVCMFNTSEFNFIVSAGDKIAQMLIQPIYCVELREVYSLDDSTRGNKGFGSSDKKE